MQVTIGAIGRVRVRNPATQPCVWELFNSNKDDYGFLDYNLYFFTNQSINSDLFLITQTMPFEKDNSLNVNLEDFSVTNLTEIQESIGNSYPMTISWKDYEALNTQVYLLARKRDVNSTNFAFEMQFTFKVNYRMNPVVKFFIGLLVTLIIVGGSFGTLVRLQLRGRINIRIPKPLRIGWFKDYISPEEIEAERLEKERQIRLKKEEELKERLAIKPPDNGKGFHISDSMFSDAESMSRDYNPNIGFDQYGAITQYVLRKNKDQKSDKTSGHDDTSNRYKSDKEFESLESFDKKTQ